MGGFGAVYQRGTLFRVPCGTLLWEAKTYTVDWFHRFTFWMHPSQLEFLSGPISCVHPSNFWLIMQHHSLVRKLLLTVFHNLRRKGRCSRSAPPALYTSPLSYLLIQDLVWQEALGLSAATAQSNSVLTAGRGCTIIWSFATWDDNATTCWMFFSMLNKVITTQLNHSGLREITVLPNLLQRTFSC